MKKEIYLDHASTTYVANEVLAAMMPYFSEMYGNPESNHIKGKEALIAIDEARETIAKNLNCKSSEIYFTSGGTEANNLAVFGIVKAKRKNQEKVHIITTTIEHSSILKPFQELEKDGCEVTFLDVDKDGLVNIEEFKKAIRPNTVFASIIYANNEIGTIQPIKEIGEICKENNVILHTDACQAAGALTLDTEELNVDLMTINGSKMYGPKGIGALSIKTGTTIEPMMYGGSHEKGVRPGTQNTPLIVGLAKSLELIQNSRETENKRLIELRNKFIDSITNHIPNSWLNGDKEKRLPNNISITVKNCYAQEMILNMDEAGIYISGKAACMAKSNRLSHVLGAIGLERDDRESTIRVTLGKRNTEEEINFAIEKLTEIIRKLRSKN